MLITGASGLLGANLTLEALDAGHEVVAVYHRHPLKLEGVDLCGLDLTEQGAAEELILHKKPDVVFHCAAATNVDACEREPEMARRLNVDMSRDVARASRAAGAHMIHISTDAVFDGVRGDYSEQDAPNPINVYAESKLAAEAAVAAEDPRAAIVRTNLFGWNAQAKFSLAEWFLHHFEEGAPFNGFHDIWFSPILVNDLARILFRVSEQYLAGIFHIAGRDCMTKYDFGCEIADIFDQDAGILNAVSVDDVPLFAARSKKLCLRVDAIQNLLGIPMPSIREGLVRFRSIRDSDFSNRLKEMIQSEEDGPY